MPLKRPAVLANVQVVLKVRGLRERIAELEETPVVQGKAASATGFNTSDDAFFKKFLLLEIKRSKRYQYPVSLLVLSLDALTRSAAKDQAPDFERATIRAQVLTAMGTLIREVDLAVVLGDDKVLLFLPHTPLEGAQNVAQRVLKTVSTVEILKDGRVSIGIACHDPKHAPKGAVSYGALMRDASAAMKRAKAAGGSRIEVATVTASVKRNRISIG
jgi:diguanylate cyclase (GGDEF)-like protein